MGQALWNSMVDTHSPYKIITNLWLINIQVHHLSENGPYQTLPVITLYRLGEGQRPTGNTSHCEAETSLVEILITQWNLNRKRKTMYNDKLKKKPYASPLILFNQHILAFQKQKTKTKPPISQPETILKRRIPSSVRNIKTPTCKKSLQDWGNYAIS